MFIIHHPSAASTMAYQFESVTIGKDGALVTLTCQEIEQDDIEGLETIRIALPLEVVAGGDAEAQAIAWLTSPVGTFPGAEIVADEDFVPLAPDPNGAPGEGDAQCPLGGYRFDQRWPGEHRHDEPR